VQCKNRKHFIALGELLSLQVNMLNVLKILAIRIFTAQVDNQNQFVICEVFLSPNSIFSIVETFKYPSMTELSLLCSALVRWLSIRISNAVLIQDV